MKNISITFNGKTETYAYENDLDYDEAVRFCGKNGGVLPTRWFLWEYDHDQGKCRWELLYEQLKEVEELPWAWTSDEYDSCGVWVVTLPSGATGPTIRSNAYYDTYALCAPAFTL